MTQSVSEHFKDFERQFRVLQANASKAIGRKPQKNDVIRGFGARRIIAAIKHGHLCQRTSTSFDAEKLLSSIGSRLYDFHGSHLNNQKLITGVALSEDGC